VPYVAARWVSSEDAAELERFVNANAYRMARDSAGVPAFLATMKSELAVAEERWPKITFHALREYTGLAQDTVLQAEG
jgi:peptide chain release factor 3